MTHHPFILHSSASSWYFVNFLSWASTIFSSQGTVNSHMITCFVTFDKMIMSGQHWVSWIWSGNFNYLQISIIPVGAESMSDNLTLLHSWIFSLALMKLIFLLIGLDTIFNSIHKAPGYGTSNNTLHSMPWDSHWEYVGVFFLCTKAIVKFQSYPMCAD